MDFLRNYLHQIKQMVGGLSRSARVALALLTVLVAIVLSWLVLYAGKPQMTPVFSTGLDEASLSQARNVLARSGMKVEVRDGQLLVPTERREEAAASLYFENLVPADAITAFEDLVSQSDLWMTERQASRQWKLAKEQTLARLIRRFPGVRDAQVIIEPAGEAGIGRAATPPTASVAITMKPGQELGQKGVNAVAHLVAGAERLMKRSDVRIVVDGRPRRAQDEEDGASGERLEQQIALETRYTTKLLEQLHYIPNVIVSVHAEPDPLRQERRTATQYDPGAVAIGPTRSRTEQTTGGGSPPGGEPGTVPNTSVSIRPPAGGASSFSQTVNEEETTPRFSESTTDAVYEGRVAVDVAASVSVPRSWLVSVWQAVNRQQAEPDEATFTTFAETQFAQIREQVMAGGIGAEAVGSVKVGWYFDVTAAAPATAPVQAGVSEFVFSYGKPAAVGALALTALLMVLMFVRRRTPLPPTLETGNPLGGLLDQTIGAAEGEDGALPGIELDEETIRTQRVVEQVSTMVKGNPDSAASLVKRWMQKK